MSRVGDACQWCADHAKDASEINYEGWVLAVREEGVWRIHPWRGGLGGAPIVLPEGDAPEEWGAHEAAVAAVVGLATDSHPDEWGAVKDFALECGGFRPAWRARLKPAGTKWRVTGAESRSIAAPAGLDANAVDRLSRASLWCWEPVGAEPSWQFEDAHGFLTTARVEGEEKAWDRARRRVDQADAWVNPYNFIPLGTGAVRGEPGYHLALGDARLSGKLRITLTAVAALALSGRGTGDENDPCAPLDIDGRYILPGAALAGLVRSFHEALTDSCLRVVDLDHTPVHRDLVVGRDESAWRMVVVEPDGAAVRLCEPFTNGGRTYSSVWVEARDLGAGALDSAHLFHWDVDAATVESVGPRLERTGGAVPIRCIAGIGCTEAHWRTIVTAALPGRVRAPSGSKDKPYHLPFARISNDVLVVSDEARKRYRLSAEHSGDVVVARRGCHPDLDVAPRNALIGYRQLTTPDLSAGQVMWVELSGGVIRRVTPSVLWRDVGEYSVGDRAPGYAPCTEVAELCPSCRVFGMAEERASSSVPAGASRVEAYRGHVRFGHATISQVDELPTRLVELGQPRPSAGQFYLENQAWMGKQAGRERRPYREWGSDADSGPDGPRRIRGRKFYWANSSTERHVAGAGAHQPMSKFHRLSQPGTVVSFDVTFDALRPTELGALIVALDPNVLRHERIRRTILPLADRTLQALLDRPLGHHLGKGKGIGLGTVAPRITLDSTSASVDMPVTIWSADRYLEPGSGVVASGLDYVAAFVDDAWSESCAERWTALLALSAVDWQPAERVKYPPDDVPDGTFRFDFWKNSSGAPGMTNDYRPTLLALPPASAPDVTINRPWLG